MWLPWKAKTYGGDSLRLGSLTMASLPLNYGEGDTFRTMREECLQALRREMRDIQLLTRHHAATGAAIDILRQLVEVALEDMGRED